MTLERSHGKARPTPPRSSDLAPVAAFGTRGADRPKRAGFQKGNTHASETKVWKKALRKVIGSELADPAAAVVARDAWSLYLAVLRSMPSDAPTVRSTCALHARHVALAGYYAEQAAIAGLLEPRGIELMALATQHGQRAERTAVTALDLARVQATRPGKPLDLAAINAAAEGAMVPDASAGEPEAQEGAFLGQQSASAVEGCAEVADEGAQEGLE